MTREMLQEKSLNDLREIARLQGVKALTKYRKSELVDIIMNGGKSAPAEEAEAAPRHSVHSMSPNGAPHRRHAWAGSMRTMARRQSSHMSSPGRSQDAQRVGDNSSAMTSLTAVKRDCAPMGTPPLHAVSNART